MILIVIRRLSDIIHTATPTHAYILLKRLESSTPLKQSVSHGFAGSRQIGTLILR